MVRSLALSFGLFLARCNSNVIVLQPDFESIYFRESWNWYGDLVQKEQEKMCLAKQVPNFSSLLLQRVWKSSRRGNSGQDISWFHAKGWTWCMNIIIACSNFHLCTPFYCSCLSGNQPCHSRNRRTIAQCLRYPPLWDAWFLLWIIWFDEEGPRIMLQAKWYFLILAGQAMVQHAKTRLCRPKYVWQRRPLVLNSKANCCTGFGSRIWHFSWCSSHVVIKPSSDWWSLRSGRKISSAQ